MPNNLSAKSHPLSALFFTVFCLCPGVTVDPDVWSELCGKLKRVLIEGE